MTCTFSLHEVDQFRRKARTRWGCPAAARFHPPRQAGNILESGPRSVVGDHLASALGSHFCVADIFCLREPLTERIAGGTRGKCRSNHPTESRFTHRKFSPACARSRVNSRVNSLTRSPFFAGRLQTIRRFPPQPAKSQRSIS